MYCEECGAWIDDSRPVATCPECGHPLGGFPVDGGAAYVPMGGTQQPYANPYPTTAYAQQPAAAPAAQPRRRGSSVAVGILCVVLALGIGMLSVLLYTGTVKLPAPFGSSSSQESEGSSSAAEKDVADEDADDAAEDEADVDDAADEDADDEADSASQQEEATVAAEPAEAQHVGFRGITSASATSYLSGDPYDRSLTYYPSNVLDGRADTCWTDGVSGGGVGESLTFSGAGVQTFSGFTILNGYHKDGRRYYQNSRPASFAVYIDGTYYTTANVGDNGLGVEQRIDFSEPVDGTTITLEVTSVYAGTKYQDTCISEIRFF